MGIMLPLCDFKFKETINMKKHLLLALLLALSTLAWAQQISIERSWKGKLAIPNMEFTLVFNLGGDKPTMDSPDQGAYGIPVTVDEKTAANVKLSVSSINANYEGKIENGMLVGMFTQHGASFPLTLSPYNGSKKERPQTPAGPVGYTEKEVSFSNGAALLSGTLTLPENFTANTPVLLMVTGSGLQNRDEEIFGHKPFAVIADHFAKAGIATLRYDDRGFGKSTGDVKNCTTDDLKNDALAGINLLRKDFLKVGVLGHSEGGTIAFMIAAEQKADFIISLAGMTVSGKELLLAQNRNLLAAANMDQTTVNAYCTVLGDIFDKMIAGNMDADKKTLVEELISKHGSTIVEPLKQNLQKVAESNTPYMQRFLALSAASLAGNVKCPVMAINGERDTQVDAAQNIGAIKGKLQGKNSMAKIYPELNHLFQHAVTGRIDEYAKIEETFSPEVLADMTKWIKQLQDDKR